MKKILLSLNATSFNGPLDLKFNTINLEITNRLSNFVSII